MDNLIWDNIVSIPWDSSEYLNKINKKKKIIKTYNKYKPKAKVIKKIREIILNKQIHIKLLVIGAEWCPDCVKYSPQLLKIVDDINLGQITLKFIYGVKVDPFHKKDDIIWHRTKSPPEAIDPKFNLEKIPTIYFFDTNGELFGKIVESPEKFSRLEREFLYILEKNFK
ncbi:MAG: TlpA family protein disulfide reductase [Promethearchaeota archaeon]